jgi:hypothetical protein
MRHTYSCKHVRKCSYWQLLAYCGHRFIAAPDVPACVRLRSDEPCHRKFLIGVEVKRVLVHQVPVPLPEWHGLLPVHVPGPTRVHSEAANSRSCQEPATHAGRLAIQRRELVHVLVCFIVRSTQAPNAPRHYRKSCGTAAVTAQSGSLCKYKLSVKVLQGSGHQRSLAGSSVRAGCH